MLQRHKELAVAKEAELVARRERQFQQLKVHIYQAINEKNNKPKATTEMVSGGGGESS